MAQTTLNYLQNRNLFSNHYLETLIKEKPEWNRMGESMLEEFMIRPILNKVLGHHFVPQAKVEQNAKRPDYAFFENEIDLNEAFIVDSKKKNDILNNNPKTNIFFKRLILCKS